jgi:hypothetical protein
MTECEHAPVHADEEGMPVLGMAPYVIKKGLDLSDLHAVHGERFWINTGPLFGKCLALNSADDVRYVLDEGHPFDSAWPGTLALKCRSAQGVIMLLTMLPVVCWTLAHIHVQSVTFMMHSFIQA